MTYKRVTKRQARKLHEEGKPYFMQSCKMSVDGIWQPPMPVTDHNDLDFDVLVNEFKYYCCNYERGYYPHFYIKEQ